MIREESGAGAGGRAAPGRSIGVRLHEGLKALASLKLTLVVLALLAAGILVSYHQDHARTWPLVLPLGLLAANLAAAVATNAVFRRQVPLLVFHLALIALVLLIAAGRLTYLKGKLELAEGEEFEGRLTEHDAGPLHGWGIVGVRFENEGFTIAYAPGVKRGPTENRVAWLAAGGETRRAVIGDQQPLVLAGYRFYTSHNKGFAPTFRWLPKQGEAAVGAVHLPSFPLHEYRQAQEWTPPGARTPLWVMLQFEEEILDPERAWAFRLPERHTLVLRAGEARHELQPGATLELAEGRLTYLGLRGWMGYTVFYDWTLPWLLATVIVAVASLGWHFWSKFARKPWDA